MARACAVEITMPRRSTWLPRLTLFAALAAAACDGGDGGGAAGPDAAGPDAAPIDAPAIDAGGLGAACAGGSACASGACVDGVCCDRACDGACEACSAATTGGADGTCAPALAGTACSTYACDGVAATCPTSCATHADCVRGYACGAASACVVAKRIFVTSTMTSGGNLGGLATADAHCGDLATAAGLPGTFKAWLSDGTTSVAQRFTHHAGPYYRVHEGAVIVVAVDWADLTNGLDPYAIGNDEHGQPAGALIWTGTLITGAAAANHCRGWTSNSTADVGMRGNSSASFYDWTAYGDGVCDANGRYYCVEQ